MNQYITHKFDIGKQKPNTILNQNTSCPFCDREKLKRENGVVDEFDDFLLVKNKFKIFEKSCQLVLIENRTCESDLSNYNKDHLHKLINYAVSKWLEYNQNSNYKSAILFKNHGPYSGGSILHPHMQIIAFEEIDYLKSFNPLHFQGIPIFIDDQIEWNLSTKPLTEFYEFNVCLKDMEKLPMASDFIQYTVHYILYQLNTRNKSYNIAFYLYQNVLYIKIISKFASSILLGGYNISQVPSNLLETVQYVKKEYLNKG